MSLKGSGFESIVSGKQVCCTALDNIYPILTSFFYGVHVWFVFGLLELHLFP